MKFLDNHHIVNGWTHADINGAGVASDVISLKNYSHLAIVLDFGNTALGGDADIVVLACDDVTPSHTQAIATLKFRKSPAAADDDAFAAEVKVTDSKLDYVVAGDIVPDTDDNAIVVIELDAADVRAAGTAFEYDCVQVTMSDPGQGCPVGCKFILSGPRHATDALPSAIID